jgi:hypothetical protein
MATEVIAESDLQGHLTVRIPRPLLKLPVRFCGETLAREVNALPSEAWMGHPQNYDGNVAIPLVSPGGALVHSSEGPMGPTAWLRRCPYIQQAMETLDATWGRSRLMGLEAGANVPEHVDIHYYWRTHLRIHIPVITNPAVAFTCDGETIHLEAGDCWILDSFYRHSVANRGNQRRIHLVLDTVGSGRIWDLIEAAQDSSTETKFIEPFDATARALSFEQINAPVVMSPWEMRTHVAYIAHWTIEGPRAEEAFTILDRFLMAWSGTWARYGISDPGLPIYLKHLEEVRARLASLGGPEAKMRNGRRLLASVEELILTNAVAPAIVQRIQQGSSRSSIFRITA